MKIVKDSKQKLLIQKIKKIIEIVDSTNPSEEEVYETVIDFIFVFEHVIKKFLFEKNKLLIYEFNLDINKVVAITKNKNHTLFTIQLSEALPRYVKMFPRSKLSKQGESIEILMKNRNQLEHSIDVKNMQSKEELLGVLSNVLPIFIVEAKKVLGILPNTKVNKEKTYSEKDIQDIFEKTILEKIKDYKKNSFSIAGEYYNTIDDASVIATGVSPISTISTERLYYNPISISENDSLWTLGKEKCPRCLKHSLSKNNQQVVLSYSNMSKSKLYICSNCNLELTDLEYATVQKLKKEGKIR